jgi:hypothetical protein
MVLMNDAANWNESAARPVNSDGIVIASRSKSFSALCCYGLTDRFQLGNTYIDRGNSYEDFFG